MNTKEILSALVEGKKLRHHGWDKFTYICISKDNNSIIDSFGRPYSSAFTPSNWELYVEPVLAFAELKVGEKYISNVCGGDITTFKVVYKTHKYIVVEFDEDNSRILIKSNVDDLQLVRAFSE